MNDKLEHSYKSAYVKHENGTPQFVWMYKKDMKQHNAQGKSIFSVLLDRGYAVEKINHNAIFLCLKNKEVKDDE